MLSFLTLNLLKSDVCTRMIDWIIFFCLESPEAAWTVPLGLSVWGLKRAMVGEGGRQNCLLSSCGSASLLLSAGELFVLGSIKKFNGQYSLSVCFFLERSGDTLADWLCEWLMIGWVDLPQHSDVSQIQELQCERKKEKLTERNGNSNKTAVGEQKKHRQALLECSFRWLQIRLRQEIAIWWRCLKWNTKRLWRVSLYFHESPFENMRTNENHREFALRLWARHFILELTHESVELFRSWSDYRQQDVA